MKTKYEKLIERARHSLAQAERLEGHAKKLRLSTKSARSREAWLKEEIAYGARANVVRGLLNYARSLDGE